MSTKKPGSKGHEGTAIRKKEQETSTAVQKGNLIR